MRSQKAWKTCYCPTPQQLKIQNKNTDGYYSVIHEKSVSHITLKKLESRASKDSSPIPFVNEQAYA